MTTNASTSIDLLHGPEERRTRSEGRSCRASIPGHRTVVVSIPGPTIVISLFLPIFSLYTTIATQLADLLPHLISPRQSVTRRTNMS